MMTMCSIITVSHLATIILYNYYCVSHLTAGPTVEPTMKVSILSSRDTLSNIVFTVSFIITFGPPSRIYCTYSGATNPLLFNIRDDHPNLSREVIRSQYVNSSQPDMACVTIKINQPREKRTYECEVTVEGRVHIDSTNYNHDPKGTGTSNVTITGE